MRKSRDGKRLRLLRRRVSSCDPCLKEWENDLEHFAVWEVVIPFYKLDPFRLSLSSYKAWILPRSGRS